MVLLDGVNVSYNHITADGVTLTLSLFRVPSSLAQHASKDTDQRR